VRLERGRWAVGWMSQTPMREGWDFGCSNETCELRETLHKFCIHSLID